MKTFKHFSSDDDELEKDQRYFAQQALQNAHNGIVKMQLYLKRMERRIDLFIGAIMMLAVVGYSFQVFMTVYFWGYNSDSTNILAVLSCISFFIFAFVALSSFVRRWKV